MHITHRLRTIVLALGTLLCLTPAWAQDEEKPNKMILIINAHTDTSPWNSDLIPQVVNMAVCDLHLEVYSESMNMMLIDSLPALDNFKSYIFEKYTKSPDVVLMLGSSSLMLLPDIRTHWGDVSVVLCSEESYTASDEFYLQKKPVDSEHRTPMTLLARKHNLTHLLSPVSLQGTIEQMRTMNPGMQRLIFLTDNRSTSRQIEAGLYTLMKSKYPEMKLEVFVAGEVTTRTLLQYLNEVDPQTTGVLLSSWYHIIRTAYSKNVETNMLAIIANTPLPIYTLRNAMLHERGFLGACTINQEHYNAHLVRVLQQILDGIPARDIPFYYPNDFRPRFNYHTMQYFGINIDTVPAEAEIIGLPPTYWQQHRYQIIAIVLLLLSSIAFVFLQRKRIIALNKLREAEHKELDLMAEHTDLIRYMPIIYSRGKIIRDRNDIPVDVLLQDVNPAFRQTFSDLGKAEGRRMGELFPKFMPTMLSFMRRINEKNPTCVIPYYADNRKRFFEIIISRTSLPDMLDLFCFDCTNLHETQEELALTNHKLAMAIEVSSITPWKWNIPDQTLFCDVNHSMGMAPNDARDNGQYAMSGDQYFSHIHPEDRERVYKAYNDLLEGRTDKLHEEYRIVNDNGTGQQIDWVEVKSAIDQRDKDGRPLSTIGSSIVITGRKNMEHQLVTAMERAEESNRLKSAFLANMSHEIRTPLNAIVGFSAMLADADTEEEKQAYLGIIRNNNDLLLQLIGDILDLSKIEAGTLDFPYADTELNQLMFEVESMMRLRLQNTAVTLAFDKPDTYCAVNTSGNRLAQVLINLLTNSIKFTQQGSILFGYGICGNMLRFYVTDTGCGIPQDKCSKIFERFVKLNRFEQGTGLGLAICQTIVEHMGGEIGVDSETGKGSTFWFTIPYTPIELQEEEPGETLQTNTDHPEQITILIAEDNPSNYQLIESILGRDYRLIHAWNGQEAVNLYQEHAPQLILMDLNMPVMDGYEATEAIRRLSSDIPIIAVTAFAYASDAERAMSSGFDDYVPKPIHPDTLRQHITHILRKRKPHTES